MSEQARELIEARLVDDLDCFFSALLPRPGREPELGYKNIVDEIRELDNGYIAASAARVALLAFLRRGPHAALDFIAGLDPEEPED